MSLGLSATGATHLDFLFATCYGGVPLQITHSNLVPLWYSCKGCFDSLHKAVHTASQRCIFTLSSCIGVLGVEQHWRCSSRHYHRAGERVRHGGLVAWIGNPVFCGLGYFWRNLSYTLRYWGTHWLVVPLPTHYESLLGCNPMQVNWLQFPRNVVHQWSYSVCLQFWRYVKLSLSKFKL